MSEIRTNYTKEQIAEYLKENNQDVLNHFQIWAKIMELELRLERIEKFLIIWDDEWYNSTSNEDNFYKSTVVKNGDGTEAKDNFVSTANEDHN